MKISEPKFILPSFEEEIEEFNRYNFTRQQLYKIRSQFVEDNLIKLSESIWGRLNNTDSYEIESLADARELAYEYDKDIDSIIEAVKNGVPLPAPIVLFKDGEFELIAGNTRLMVYRAFNKTPKVLLIDLD
jgi:hypothetical protein